MALTGLTLIQTGSTRFFGFTSLRADEAGETVLPEEEFTLEAPEAVESGPAEEQTAETAAEAPAEEPEGVAVAAPQEPLPNVVDESAKQAEEPESYSTENPEAADAKVMQVDPDDAATEPIPPSESVEENSTPPVMEETIIS
ncbi:MAG: hypothetical protein IKT12_06290, partial [Thermoguttaceae bacterium]|nr:hypothetical protein [Thermoguttaceae bacterium]